MNVPNLKINCMESNCPLELIQVEGVASTGCLSYMLQLSEPSQPLTFPKAGGLIGKNLTLVIPTYYKKDCHFFQIEQPDLTEITLHDIHGCVIPLTLVNVPSKNAYYLSLEIVEGMLTECDLIIEVSKLKLNLVKSKTSPGTDSIKKSYSDNCYWKWICSVTIDESNCNPEPSIGDNQSCGDDTSIMGEKPTCVNKYEKTYIFEHAGGDGFLYNQPGCGKSRYKVGKHWSTLQTLFDAKVYV